MARWSRHLQNIQSAASAFTRGSAPWRLLMTIAVALILSAGFHMVYQLFFLELPIEDIARTAEGGERENFRYDGVVYFEGVRLEQMESRTLHYQVPRVVSNVRGKHVEFFVRIDEFADRETSLQAGRLRVTQGKESDVHLVDLEPKLLQRVRVPWEPTHGERNTFRVRFQATEPGGLDPESTVESIVLGSNIRQVNLWPRAAVLGLLGLLAFAAGVKLRGGMNWIALVVIVLPLLVMAWIHSGALISNEYVSGHHRLEGMARQTDVLLRTGTFRTNMYRSTGFAVIPLATLAVEGGTYAFDRDYAEIYPTSRYLIFIWTALSLAALLLVLHRRLGWAPALIVGLLYATHYPFIVDLYVPDADAYFIPLMTLILAAFIAYCATPSISWKLLAAIGVLFFLMLSTKITPAYLAALFPAACWARTIVMRQPWFDRPALALLAVMLVSGMAGKYVAEAFHHPERNVGIEGVEFQDHVFWHMIWASYGNYDHHSAHGFTRSGGLRNERVAERTGLPITTYLRQSQIATEEVYRPDVMNALKERPGFFYSTAHLRAYVDGVRFRKYTFGPSDIWSPWLTDGFRQLETISGSEVYALHHERRLIRYGKMWKVAPIVWLTKLTQGELTFGMDVALILLGLIGIALIRRVDMAVALFGLVAAHYTFNTWIHSMSRYMIFNDVAILIGLGVFVTALLGALTFGASQTIKPGRKGVAV